MSLLADLQAACAAEPGEVEVRLLGKDEFIQLVQPLIDPTKYVRHDDKGNVTYSYETTPGVYWSQWWPSGDVAGIVSMDGDTPTHAVVVDRVTPTRVYIRMRFGPPNPRSWFRKVWKRLGVKELEYVTSAVSKIRMSDKNKSCTFSERPHGPNHTHVVQQL